MKYIILLIILIVINGIDPNLCKVNTHLDILDTPPLIQGKDCSEVDYAPPVIG